MQPLIMLRASREHGTHGLVGCRQGISGRACCGVQGLVPEKARLEVGSAGEWREVPTDALVAGDVLSVLPGDRVPVDGVVLSGSSSANEAALTGEPMPVPKAPGEHLAFWMVQAAPQYRWPDQQADHWDWMQSS